MIGERRFWGCDKPVTSLRSHTISVPEEDLLAQAGVTGRAVEELLWKLNAEHERLLRLLPDPPVGYHWEFETLREESLMDYSVRFRERAVLKENV